MKVYRLTAILCALIFFRCSAPGLSGPTTEEGNPVIAGIVRTPHGSPVSKAAVMVVEHANSDDSTAAPHAPRPIAATTTDAQGAFAFYTIPGGTYSLEAAGSERSLVGAVVSVEVRSGITARDTIVLRTPGTVRGVVTRNGRLGGITNTNIRDGFIDVILAQLHRSAVSGPDGTYELANVPQGTYRLLYRADDGFFTTSRDSIRVVADSVTHVDTVKLNRIPWLAPPKPSALSADYDSASSTVTLTWSMLDTDDIIGYQVERRIDPILDGKVFSAAGRRYVDSLESIAPATAVHYLVRSVNSRMMTSANEGPVTVLTR